MLRSAIKSSKWAYASSFAARYGPFACHLVQKRLNEPHLAGAAQAVLRFRIQWVETAGTETCSLIGLAVRVARKTSIISLSPRVHAQGRYSAPGRFGGADSDPYPTKANLYR
jgi:hypothetical protein